MSATYMHYSTPSSLPSDYALLSRYAAARGADHPDDASTTSHDDEDRDDIPADEDDAPPAHRYRPIQRRSSFPAPYIRPPNPKLPEVLSSKRSVADEFTPLLVPRIEEEEDHSDTPEPGNLLKIYKDELRILMKYTLPVFGTHVLEYSLVVASVVAIGHLSTNALAAATLGSMTASVSGFSIIQGFASTLDTMLPSAWTSSQPQLVGLWAQRMAVVMSVSLIPVFVIWFNAESILLFLHQEPEVARLAGLYLKYLSISLPAYTFNSISRRYFQSQGKPVQNLFASLFTVPTQIIVVIAPINAVLNWLLAVWGPKPIALGFIGAPIATSISYNLVSLASIVYGIFFVPKTAWHPLSRRTFTSLGVLVQLGLAGVGQTASEWWSWELVGRESSLALSTRLGPVSLATQSVLLVSASTTYQAPFALSVATSVRIGNLLGEQNALRAGVSSRVAMLMALGIAGLCSALFLTFRAKWGLLFNDDPSVVTLVASIMPLVALFQVFDALSAVSGGILRARGKQFTGALLNLSPATANNASFILGIPFGVWLAFSRGMELHGLWIGLTVSLVYSAVVGVYLCLVTDWPHELDKVQKRLAADKHVRYDAETPA
ncbi:MATE efflux family protein [Auriscalpium vulgare]|uniref:MATE efflux family protein n=1 Tax=Auriscalpium vulgare TaxID=40419 RepID=A0ACB8R9D7_9AGAM|nr:MATE efflux family protein [Auriscalpium vulgare]